MAKAGGSALPIPIAVIGDTPNENMLATGRNFLSCNVVFASLAKLATGLNGPLNHLVATNREVGFSLGSDFHFDVKHNLPRGQVADVAENNLAIGIGILNKLSDAHWRNRQIGPAAAAWQCPAKYGWLGE